MALTLKKNVVRVVAQRRSPSAAQLHGKACIDCGRSDVPLSAAGMFYMRSGGARLGWSVVACSDHEATAEVAR
jgi:hypothetical protein